MLRVISHDKSHAGSCGGSHASLRARGHMIGHVSSHSHMLVGVRVQVTWYFPRVMYSELKFITYGVLTALQCSILKLDRMQVMYCS